MATAEPPSDRPALIRRAGCWIAFLTVIPLLVGSVFCLENWFGARALARAQAKVAAAGLDLDPKRLPSIRPPDAENFCATPLLLDHGPGAPSSQALKELEERSARWQRHLLAHDVDVQSPFSPAPTDWTRVRDALATEDSRLGLIKGSPAPLADLAECLDRELGAVLTELSAALPRPRSVFVPTLREKFRDGQDPSTVAGNHLGSMNSLVRTLSFHHCPQRVAAYQHGPCPHSHRVSLFSAGPWPRCGTKSFALPRTRSSKHTWPSPDTRSVCFVTGSIVRRRQ